MKYKDLPSAKTFLEFDRHGNPSDRRLKVCVLLLLWEVASADGNVSKEEFHKIIRTACYEFHIMDDEAGEILDIVAFLDNERIHFDKFIGEVNRMLNREQREYLFLLMLDVAKVDNYFSAHEGELLSTLRDKLNLN